MDRNKSATATENLSRKSLGEVLVEENIITAEQLRHALELQRSKGGKLGDILVSQGVVVQGKCQGLLFSDFVSKSLEYHHRQSHHQSLWWEQALLAHYR
jgi:hypothetical protein